MSYTDPDSQDNGPVIINESKDILMDSWRTELNAPEILPFKEELVEEILELLSEQEVITIFGQIVVLCIFYTGRRQAVVNFTAFDIRNFFTSKTYVGCTFLVSLFFVDLFLKNMLIYLTRIQTSSPILFWNLIQQTCDPIFPEI